jgi:hypothetical protein
VAYATVEELRSVLGLDTPTQLQMERMARVLDEAADEIDWELGYGTGDPPITVPSPVPPLVIGVNLDRAVEHWRQTSSPFGAIVVGGTESAPVLTARNSWYRHAIKLAPLREHRGIA